MDFKPRDPLSDRPPLKAQSGDRPENRSEERSPQRPLGPLPACQVCGRQDESLRLAVYPYVYSLIVMTFRRSFQGLWCGRHRAQKALLAGLITASTGWLGIPFGLFYALLVLYRLAKGGELPAEENARLLRALAEIKTSRGDLAGARRCWEASLRFADDSNARARLSGLYQGARSPGQEGAGLSAAQFWLPFLVLIAATVLSDLVGGLDYLFTILLSLLVGEESSLIVAVLSWVPLVALAFTSLLLGRELVVWVLERLRPQQPVAAASFAGAAALLGVYGLAQGKAVGQLVDMALAGYGFASPAHLLSSAGAVLLRGGAWEVLDAFQGGQTWGLIYTILLLVLAVLFLDANLSAAFQIARWQARLAMLQPAYPGAGAIQPSGLLLVSAGVAGALLLGALALPQQGLVDYFEAGAHYQRGVQFWDQGNLDSAVVEVEAALVLNPGMSSWQTELGWLHYYRGDYPAAQAIFNQVLAAQLGDSTAHLGLGWTYLDMGDYAAASQAFQQALANQPDLAAAQAGLGWVYLGQDDYPAAEQAFTRALDLDPLLSDARQGLGSVWLAQAQFEQAIDVFQQAVEGQPDSFDAHYALGQAYLAAERPEEAILAFEQALRLAPESGPAYLELGIAHYHNEAVDAAVAALEQAAARMPGSVEPLAWLGQISLDQHDPERAAELLEQALQIDPQDPYVRFTLGLAYWVQGPAAPARDHFLAASNLYPQWGAPQAMLADVFHQTGQLEALETAIQNALAVSAGDDLTHYLLAGVYFDRRDFPAAQAQLEQALASAPDDTAVLASLGYAHSAQGHTDQVLATAKRILVLDPQESRGYVLRAEAYLEQEDLISAEAELALALQLDADNDSALRSLAFIYLQQGRLAEARAAAQAALAIDPYYAGAYTVQALIAYEEGDLPAAFEAAQRAIELRPARDLPHYVLGVCRRAWGDREAASRELQAFLDLYWERAYVRNYRAQAEAYLAEMGAP